MEKKLFRDVKNKLLGGVSSGLACYFNFDASIIRLLWILLTICSGPWTIIVYTIMWIILPQGDSSVYNVEPDAEFQPVANNKSRGCFSGCLILLFGLFLAYIALFVLIIVFSILLGSFALLMGVISGDIALHEAIQTMLQ